MSCSRACFFFRAVLLFVFAVLFAPDSARATIGYSVSIAQPEQHSFRVTMSIPNVKEECVVQLPAWNATYQIRDFAQRIQDVRARDGAGATLPLEKLDKQTWRIRGRGKVTVEYSSFWDEPGPFSSQLNSSHAFINLALILFYVPARRAEDVRIDFADVPANWAIGLALRPGETSSTFLAASYDALADAPVEISEFQQFRFAAHGGGRDFTVRVVVHGDNWSQAQLSEVLRKIVVTGTDLMRDAPFEEFLFIYHFGAAASGAGGGMEHANSTAIHVGAAGNAAGVSAHEFFHLWNVKRVRPRSLEPVDYTRENWTRALWFAEGVTSTFANYILLRSGLWTRRQFLDDLAQQLTELESRPAHRWKSVEEASLDAWFEKYALYRRSDFSISYYNKGQILGVLLDILMRDASDNRAGLDDLMRALNENFAKRGRTYEDTADIRATAEKLAGKHLGDFFARYVSGTAELPAREMLAHAGLRLETEALTRADFGFITGHGPDGLVVATQVESGSAAEQAGLRLGDILLEVNGGAFPRNAERWLREHHPGETVKLRIRRNGAEREVSLTLGRRQESVYTMEEDANAGEKQRRIRESLLRGVGYR